METPSFNRRHTGYGNCKGLHLIRTTGLLRIQTIKTNGMEAQRILQSSLLDILFDGRNQSYGAYELRKHYNNRLSAASAAGFLLAIACSAFMLNREKSILGRNVIYNDTIILAPLPLVEPAIPRRPSAPKPPEPRPRPRLRYCSTW